MIKSIRLDDLEQELKAAVLKRLAYYRARGKYRKRIPVPRAVEPRMIENAYFRALRSRFKAAIASVEQRLFPALEQIARQYDVETGRQIKRDSATDDFTSTIGDIEATYLREATDDELKFLIRKQGLEVNEHNLAQFRKQYRQLIALDVVQAEPWIAPILENYLQKNVDLIKSVEQTYFQQIKNVALEGFQSGLQVKDITERLRQRGIVSTNRLELIARDQVQKLNGQLTKERQTRAGVSKYIWRTSLDERVRPEHAAREGEQFAWDNPPSDGHPGEPINCRCYAEPVFEDVIDESA